MGQNCLTLQSFKSFYFLFFVFCYHMADRFVHCKMKNVLKENDKIEKKREKEERERIA